MKTRFNLQPWREAQRQKKQKEFITITAVIALIVAGVMGLNYFLEKQYIDSQLSAQSYLKEEVAKLETAKKKVEDTKSLIDEIDKQITSIGALQAQRGTVLKLLDHLANETPDTVFIDRMQFDGNRLTIQGVAKNDTGVADFMRAVQRNSLLQTATLDLMQSAPSTSRYIVPAESEIKSFTVIVDMAAKE